MDDGGWIVAVGETDLVHLGRKSHALLPDAGPMNQLRTE